MLSHVASHPLINADFYIHDTTYIYNHIQHHADRHLSTYA